MLSFLPHHYAILAGYCLETPHASKPTNIFTHLSSGFVSPFSSDSYDYWPVLSHQSQSGLIPDLIGELRSLQSTSLRTIVLRSASLETMGFVSVTTTTSQCEVVLHTEHFDDV